MSESMPPARSMHPAVRMLPFTLLALVSSASLAQSVPPVVTWGSDDGQNWTAGFWDGITGSPQAGDDVRLLAPAGSFSGSQTVPYDETGAPAYDRLVIDATAPDSMTLTSANDLNVTGNFVIGKNGSGAFVQSGGDVTAAQVLLGGEVFGTDTSNGNGQYTMSGGSLTASALTVGNLGSGTFTQSAGAVATGQLTLGSAGGTPTNSFGQYFLSGSGTLATSQSVIGGIGRGEFTQSGGTHTISGDLILGNAPALTGGTPARGGFYTLSGGQLTVGGNTIVGAGNDGFTGEPGGSGSFTQSGGTHLVAGNLLIGNAGTIAGGSGSYVLSGGTLDVGNQSLIGAGGSGTFTQSGGSYATDYLDVGIVSGSTGSFTIHAGSATARVNLVVGSDATTNAVVIQSGGSVFVQSPDFGLYVNGSYTLSNTDGAALLSITHDAVIGDTYVGSFSQLQGTVTAGHDLILGSGTTAGANGFYSISGGILGVSGRVIVGQTTGVTGSYVQSGSATVTVGGDFIVANLAGSSGTVLMSGGSLLVHGSSGDNRIVVGGLGSGGFTLDGGSVTADGLSVGNNAGGSGTFTLNGGTLTITSAGDFGRSVIGALGTGSFVQLGGTHTTTDLVLGNNPGGGQGSYFLYDGSVIVSGTTWVGATAFGSLAQLGGTLQTDVLRIGGVLGVSGVYALDGGTLQVTSLAVIGDGGTGTFHQSGGSVQVDGTLILGRLGQTSGSYALTAGSLHVGGDAIVGLRGEGHIQQSGGIAIIGGDLLIGADAGGVGRYQLDNGTLAVGGTIVLGGTPTADGGSGELALTGTANLYANGLDLRPGGTLSGLGGGITLGDSEQGNAEAGSVLVNRGGTLAGNGTIPGSVIVNDGGIVSPGNSIGRLTVGDIVFGSGSTLRIEVDGAGNADLLHSTGTVTIDGGTLRIESTDGNFSTAAPYTILTADNGISGSFPNVVSSLPLFALTATYTGTAITLSVPTPDENAATTAADLIGGSPASLLGRMTLGDVEAGFLLDPLATGFAEGQAGIGGRVGRYFADGYRQTYQEMPIRYAWKLDNGSSVLAELPIATITTTGHGVERRDHSYGLGGGLRIPVLPGWELKPMLRYGTVVNDDYEHIGSLASASVTSHFRHRFGNDYEFGADNLIGYFKSVGGRVAGLDARYELHEVALHNAVRVGGPLEGSFLGSGARWTAWFSDTRFVGSDLAADNFQRIGIAATTRVGVGDRFSENLSLGLHWTQSAGGDHGVELNFGYRF